MQANRVYTRQISFAATFNTPKEARARAAVIGFGILEIEVRQILKGLYVLVNPINESIGIAKYFMDIDEPLSYAQFTKNIHEAAQYSYSQAYDIAKAIIESDLDVFAPRVEYSQYLNAFTIECTTHKGNYMGYLKSIE